MPTVTIKDRPCGWGKTTAMIQSFKPEERYIVVVPYLTETQRIETEAADIGILFSRPGFEHGEPISGTKGDHLRTLIQAGKNIVCTHELFYRLGSFATEQVPKGHKQVSLLCDYHLIIDEVLNPFEQFQGVSAHEFNSDYLGLGLVSIDQTGLISPTMAWDDRVAQGSKTFDPNLYYRAKSGSLYQTKGDLFVSTIPLELLTKSKSVTVLTFLNEGSFFRYYLEQLDRSKEDITLVIDKLPSESLRAWKSDVASALTILSIPALESTGMSYTAQTKYVGKPMRLRAGNSVGVSLMNFRNREPAIMKVAKEKIGLTCAKINWFSNKEGEKPHSSYWSKNSRMFGHPQKDQYGAWTTSGVSWIANTTRGTNKHSELSHAVYLYDQHPNPQIANFLSCNHDPNFGEAYALAELVQWLFRFQIRKGGFGRLSNGEYGQRGNRQPTTVFIPCERMRNLLSNWLADGNTDQNVEQTSLLAA